MPKDGDSFLIIKSEEFKHPEKMLNYGLFMKYGNFKL